jgi:hypothetical protein
MVTIIFERCVPYYVTLCIYTGHTTDNRHSDEVKGAQLGNNNDSMDMKVKSID